MVGNIPKVPQVMQMEALECGAACLTMILAFHGCWMPLEKVRADCGVSRDGSKASNILKAARVYGLAAKGMTYSIDAIRKKGMLPCIIFWNFNHFVVLRGFKGKYAFINDPARGQVKVSMQEFEESFTGIALVFEKTDAFKEGGQKPNPFSFAQKRLEGLGYAVCFIMLASTITSIVTICDTSLGKVFMDRILTGNDPEWLFPLMVLMLALALISGLVSVLNAIYLMRIQGKIAVVSSSRFMRHLLHLPIGFYSQRMVGDLQQRQSANESIAYQLIGQLAPVLINTVMLVFYLIIMLNYSILLTAVGVLTVLANAMLARFISAKRVNIARAEAMNFGKLYSTTVGGIEMIETIKAAGAEQGYFNRWAGYEAAVNESDARTTRLNEYLGAVLQILSSIANILVLVIGIWLIIEGEFTPGMLLAFTGFLAAFMAPVTQIISLGQTILELQTQMERVEDVMRYPEDVSSNETDLSFSGNTVSSEKLYGKVDLNNITFGYSPLDPPLIQGFSLHINPGDWVALVGGSGCGKSTVAKLISGLYKPWSGEILFDDVPIADVPRPVLRGSLAVVDQDIVAFEDTVSDNVRLWDRSIEDYEVILACRDSAIHDIILDRPGGYSSSVMPGGRNFSGGQLQRLEIARVLAQDPTVIVLDEATSSLDAQTEAEVIRRIRDRGITCIVIAHRLSTIRDCDEIIVLDEGSVVERGTHAELLALDGAYAELVRND